MKHKIVILLLLFVSFVSAQEEKQTYSFSLEEAISYALQNNYKAINASRDIEAAKQKKWETTATGLPQINGNVNYQNNIVLQKSVVPAEFFGGNPGEFAEVEFGTKHNMTASASLTQLIFDGSYIVALQASKTYLKYYQNYKVKTDNETREMVTNYYGNVLLAKENIAILEKNKATLEKNVFEAEQTYKNGLIEEESVEQLQITLASVNSSLSNMNRLVDISTNMLKINLGLTIDDTLILTDNLDALATQKVDLTATSESFNVANNIDYQIAENFREQRRLEYKLQKAAYLPKLSASANFGYNAFSNEFTFFQQDQKWFNFSYVGVNLNVPIFGSFGKRAKSQQAKIAFEQAETQLTEAEQMLKLQYESAKSDYEFSIEQYATSKSNLKLAERIENKQQIKFREGLSTSFEFTEAQRQLYTAQQNYLQSMIDVINKKTALEKITNPQ